MKTIVAAIAFGALLASSASAQSFYVGAGPGYVPQYGVPDAMNNAASGLRRSNLNPRDPAYAGSDGLGYESDTYWDTGSRR